MTPFPRFTTTLFSLLLGFTLPSAASSNENDFAQASTWEVVYKASLLTAQDQARLNGYHGNLDLKFHIDGEKAWGIPGSEWFVYVLHNHGNRLNDHLGVAQGVDNIEAHTNTLIYQLWYQQHLWHDKLSVLVGLYDLNSEFYATPASGLFLLPPFGIGPDLAQTGQNGPSIFPVTSMSLRLKARPLSNVPGVYAQAALLDAVPGDPAHPKGTHVRFGKHDGALQVAEVGYESGAESADDDTALPVSKLALGFWRYTEGFDALIDTDVNGDPLQRRQKGWYVLAETVLYRDRDNPARGLSGFVRHGRAPAALNRFEAALDAGLVYTGLFNGREKDQFGFGVAAARTGAPFRQLVSQTGEPVLTTEIEYELSYRARINEHVAVQPVLQHVRKLGDARFKNISLMGVRLEFNFGSD